MCYRQLKSRRAQKQSANVQSSWNMMAHGDALEGIWRGNWRMEWVAITLHTTSEHGVSSINTAYAHTSAAIRLNWRPCRLKWARPFRRKAKSGFCACAITFQKQSTTYVMTSQLWNRPLGACAYTDFYRCRMWTHVSWDITPRWMVNSRTLREQTQSTGILDPENGGTTILRNVFFTIVWPCIVTDSLWIKPTDTLKSSFIGITTLHVSGSLSAHHEFLAVHRLWHILSSCDDRLLPGVGWNAVPSYSW